METKTYAVDIDPKFISQIKELATAMDLTSISNVAIGNIQSTNLTPATSSQKSLFDNRDDKQSSESLPIMPSNITPIPLPDEIIRPKFRLCGDCHLCCQGALVGEVYGQYMGPNAPCSYLNMNKGCTTYSTRPSMCVNYQCAWSQGLFSEKHRPDKVGFLVSVEKDQVKQQYLNLVPTAHAVDPIAVKEVYDFARSNNTYVKSPFPSVNVDDTSKPSAPVMTSEPIDPLDLILKELIRLDEKDQAKALVRTFHKHSHTIEQLDKIGQLAFQIKDYDTAVMACRAVVKLIAETTNIPEQLYAAYSNLMNSLAHNIQPDEAYEILMKLKAYGKNDPDLKLKEAYIYYLFDRKGEAEAILRERLSDPNLNSKVKDEIRFNLATYDFNNGKFKEGMYGFLTYGPAFNTWNRKSYPFTKWDGKYHENGFILVIAEAGIGDEFINVRFMHNIRKMGMDAVWFTSRSDLVDLFNRNDIPSIDHLSKLNKHPTHYCYSMSLPLLLDLDAEELWTGPYLTPSTVTTSAIWDILNREISLYPTYATNGLMLTVDDSSKIKMHGDCINYTPIYIKRIGIRWQGNPYYDQDIHRTIPYQGLVDAIQNALGDRISYQICSLQKDEGIGQLDEQVFDTSPYLNTFNETLAIMANMDLIITSCTSIAHAAGATGCKVIVLVPVSAYYVWCHPTEKSPWYGENVTLIRQTKAGEWGPVLEKLTEVLKQMN